MDDCIAWFWCCTRHSVCWSSSESVLLSCPWTRTTNCTEKFASRVVQPDLCAACSSLRPLGKVHVLGSLLQEGGRSFIRKYSFHDCQSLTETEQPPEQLSFWLASGFEFEVIKPILSKCRVISSHICTAWLSGKCLLVLWNVLEWEHTLGICSF